LENEEAKRQYLHHGIKVDTLEDRVRHVVQSCFNGRRLVIFSGGEAKEVSSILEDARAIATGGGNGLIIGRNSFQRPREEALEMLDGLTHIFKEQK
jgi:class I fructose-bisphosphate aldolase